MASVIEPANGARGEVPLQIGTVNLVIAAEMGRLAAVSTRLECKSLSDLFLRLSGVEAAATVAALELLTVRGDYAAALKQLKLRHFAACGEAFQQVLSHHFDGDEGNEPAAPETAN